MSVSSKNLARWYRETSQNLNAGLPLPRAMEAAGGTPARDRKHLVARLRAGETIDAVLKDAPGWFPELDRYVLSSAAQSGQMVETLRVLAEKRAFLGKQAAQALGAILYPLFIVHFAVLAAPIYLLIMESTEAYLRVVVPLLLPLWAVIALLSWSVRRRHRWVGWLMRSVPLLRGYSKNGGIADLCFTLRAYLAAGAAIDVAWRGAARACGERRLQRLGEAVSERARLGTPPGVQIRDAKALPEDFISLYQNGELTGQLEENLDHLWVLYSERAAGKLRAASFWYPILLILGVAAGVGYFIIMTYAGYLNEVTDML